MSVIIPPMLQIQTETHPEYRQSAQAAKAKRRTQTPVRRFNLPDTMRNAA
jgi:hypothetical protein